MYQKYWGLKEKPFENTPNPDYIYRSSRHEEALSRMLYVVQENKGAGLLTGEYGSGKTLLTRVILRELSSDKYQTALLLNPLLSPAQLIREIMTQLGEAPPSKIGKAELFNRLNKLLFEIKKNNKSTVVVVDEAQAIKNKESFEELRLLLNFQLDNSFLLTLLLFGQPELKDLIEKLPQFKQRLAIRYHLTALTEQETKEYVLHRLKVAGDEKEIFQPEAFEQIFIFSQGIPRKINNICDLALLVGSGEHAQSIGSELIKQVGADLEGKPTP